MFRTLPPTGAPIYFRDLLKGFSLSFSENDSHEKFSARIKKYFSVNHVFLLSSGKAAIYVALAALRKASRRDEVIIPAYSSFCLASAVARSGLSARLCDIDPETLDFDLDQLRSLMNENTLAVIPVHNYGLTCNLAAIRGMAGEKGAFILEDAAQAAGASIGERKAGSAGDIGILSLGRGKNICALGGGILITDKAPVAGLVCDQVGGFTRGRGLTNLGTGLALSVLLNPERYALPASLPFLNLGANIFDPNFDVEALPRLNAAVGGITFGRLDEYNAARVRNAELLKSRLMENRAVRIPGSHSEGEPVYLRLPVLLRDGERRERLWKKLNQEGLGASRSYPSLLDGIPGFRKHLKGDGAFPGAEFVLRRILTLPTHPHVEEGDIRKITEIFMESAGQFPLARAFPMAGRG